MKKTILLAAALVAGDGVAQQPTEGVEPYVEYKKRVETAQNISPLDNGMFGESTSLYNGSTSFTVVDIDLPGNNGLPVQLARTVAIDIQPQGTAGSYDTLLRGIGNWQVDVPHMAATYPQNTGWSSSRCSVGSVPPITASGALFLRAEYWNGISISLPGRGGTSALGLQSQSPKPSNHSSLARVAKVLDMMRSGRLYRIESWNQFVVQNEVSMRPKRPYGRRRNRQAGKLPTGPLFQPLAWRGWEAGSRRTRVCTTRVIALG